ncbi:MAG: hypothetical protein IJP13_08405 [Lachnospiraceae bacterium]|nr:hypothetical protein [Lachnospiraceae bacterium]
MKKISLRKMNNAGSTFILAIVIISLVTTLALAIMAASMSNISMKNVDRNVKSTFYTAESVLDEIRAGVGLDTMNNLGKAYEKVLTNIVKISPEGYSYIIDNDSANEQFKSIFMDYLIAKMTEGQISFAEGQKSLTVVDPAIRQRVLAYIQGYIKGYDAGLAKIESIGQIEAYKNADTGISYMLIIKDVNVSYKEEKSGETYFSNVLVDLEIQFPNMTVDFSSTNRLDDFLRYGIIADRNLTINGSHVTAKSSIYAGNIVNILASSVRGGQLNMVSDLAGQNINLICGGDNGGASGSIIVTGNADNKSSFTAASTDIWCTNLTTGIYLESGKDKTDGAIIDIDSMCNTYVKDDLTSEGKYSEIDVEGNYYGYSYDGYDDSLGHVASSAIIINGEESTLTLGTNRMILGGHAYIDLNGADADYMTGEALSFKGNQEIYLIPSEYLGKNYGPVPNPMPRETWEALKAAAEADSSVKICDVTNFFAYKQGYLATVPYTVRTANTGLVYVYLNFHDKDSAASYVKDVANGLNGADSSLSSKLDKYTAALFDGNGAVTITGGNSDIYTKGALLITYNGLGSDVLGGNTEATAGDLSYASNAGTISTDDFVLTSMDLKNRYSILTHLLVDLPWTDELNGGKRYIVNDIDSALWQKKDYLLNGNEINSTNMFDFIIDDSWLASKPYNSTGAYIQYGEAGMNYIKIAIDGDYIVPSNCNGGVIVASGTVRVSKDFDGMIIAGEDIIIDGNATITSNEAMVRYLITNESSFKDEDITVEIPFREYFKAFKHSATDDDSREEVKVETVDYKDLVNFNNWRKYEE